MIAATSDLEQQLNPAFMFELQVINKVTIHYLPAPTFVLVCQLVVSALTAKIGDATGVLEADKLEWPKIKRFIWVIVGFLGTIFCNIKVSAPRFVHSPHAY